MLRLRRIVAIARKEMLVLMGKPKSRFMVILPPIIQIFVFAWAATMEVKNVDVLVLDQDAGVWSQEVISRLRGAPTFKNLRFVESYTHIEEAINEQNVLFAMVFQNDFSQRMERGEPANVQLLLDGRRSNTAQIVAQYVEVILADVGQNSPAQQTMAGAGGSSAPVKGQAQETGPVQSQTVAQAQAVAQVKVHTVNWFNPNLDFQWFILPNLIGMINFIMGIIITGLTVARERELGTFDQLLVSPAEPAEIAVGKLIPGCVVGLTHGTIFLVAARFFFEVPFVGSLGILYGSMFLFSLSVSSMGLMISSLTSTQQQAFLGAFTVAVPCILLSGFMTPINNMPIFLQNLSQLNPLRHFIVIIQGVFLKDISLPAAMDSGARITAIALVSVVLAVWMFKRRA